MVDDDKDDSVGTSIIANPLKIVGVVSFDEIADKVFLDYSEESKCHDIVSNDTREIIGRFDQNSANEKLIVYETDFGLWYEHGSFDQTKEHEYLPTVKRSGPVFTWATAHIIVLDIMRGLGLTDVCKKPGMPSLAVVSFWRRNEPEFDQMLEVAYEVRGELVRDEIASIANELENIAHSEFELKVFGKKTDLLKWLAGQDNSKYSPKSEVKHSGNMGSIIIETGVRKSSDNDKEDYSIVDVTPDKGEDNG